MTNNNNYKMDFDEAVKFVDKKSEELDRVNIVAHKLHGFEDIVLSEEELKLLHAAFTCDQDLAPLKERKDDMLKVKANLELELNKYKKDYCDIAQRVKDENLKFGVMLQLLNSATTNILIIKFKEQEIKIFNNDINNINSILKKSTIKNGGK